jgi:hypothetical protein
MISLPLIILSIIGYFVEESFKNDIAQKVLVDLKVVK